MTRNFGDDELQRLYKKAEFDREHKEVKKIEKRIRSLVDEISVYIGCKDPLFKNFGRYLSDYKMPATAFIIILLTFSLWR